MFNNKESWKGKISRFLMAQTISLLGSSLVQYAIVWYITLFTSSGKMLTISTICGFLPQIAISLFAGAWLDRYDRKKMIMLADSMIAFTTLLLALLFAAGHKNIGLLFVLLVIRSVGTGIQTPAVNAIIPQLVPQKKLMRINGINSTLSSVIMFLSPAASGALLSVLSFEAVLFIDVITAVFGVGITAAIKIERIKNPPAGPNQSEAVNIKQGFMYLKQHSLLKRLLPFQLIVLFLISPSAFLTPLMVSRTFGAEVWRLAVSEMTYSLGMVLGGLVITSWGGFKNRMKTVAMASAAYGAVMVGLGMSPVFAGYLFFNTVIGITAPCYNAPITVSVQELVEPQMQGRIFSFMQISTSCALPLGMAVFGPLADLIRIQWILVAAGVMVLAVTGYAYCKFFAICYDNRNSIKN